MSAWEAVAALASIGLAQAITMDTTSLVKELITLGTIATMVADGGVAYATAGVGAGVEAGAGAVEGIIATDIGVDGEHITDGATIITTVGITADMGDIMAEAITAAVITVNGLEN
jgi:hypothetical protein